MRLWLLCAVTAALAVAGVAGAGADHGEPGMAARGREVGSGCRGVKRGITGLGMRGMPELGTATSGLPLHRALPERTDKSPEQLFHSFSTAFPQRFQPPRPVLAGLGSAFPVPGAAAGPHNLRKSPGMARGARGGHGGTGFGGVPVTCRSRGSSRCCPHSQPCAPGDPDPTLPSAGPAAAAQTLLRLLLRAERGELEPPGCGNAGMRGAGSGVGA